ISDTIRKVVQGTKFNEEMHPLTDVYLYAASRAQTLSTIVKPTVDAGGIVIADRSYITSLAIQGGAQKQGIETVLSVNEKAIETVTPDLVIYLYMDPTSSMHRTFDEDGDKWESKTTEFNYEIAKGYDVAAELPSLKKIWNRIDIDKSMDIPSVAEMVWQVVEPLVTTISQ
ncbi:thymidylate kinase, partial [candidate division WWE3 bacterium]|nr:thymidylate kinase [candidate division WWE3 bacterium]